MNYKIELATENDLEAYHQIIIDRCNWLADNNINQWKVNSYPIRYNIDYFKDQMQINKLYIAKKDDEVCGGLLLKDSDEKYWNDNPDAYYVHHLATKINESGLGKILIEFVINQAIKDNKDYFRLDCVSHNEKLNNYYKKLGFEQCGQIQIKNWTENLWQIKLKR